MTTSAELKVALNAILPPEMQYQAATLAEMLIDIINKSATPYNIEKQISSNPSLVQIIQQLAGRQIVSSDTLLSFGSNNQIGDITIKDIAGGDIVTISVSISSATPEQANIALALETIPGFFGLLGLGHIYSGRTSVGISAMLGWFLYIFIGSGITSMTLGAAGCLTIPILIVVPVVSGLQARKYIQKTGSEGDFQSVLKIGGGGCLLVVMVFAVFMFIVFAIGNRR